MPDRKKLQAIVAAIVAVLLAGGGIVIEISDDDGDGRPDVTVKRPTKTLPSPPGVPPVVADADQEVQADEAAESSNPNVAAEGPGIHEDARDETPPGAPADAAKQIDETPTEGLGKSRPVGGAQNYSCTRHLVRNHSARAHGRVELVVVHYAVAPPGSLPVIRRLFDTSSFGASSHAGMEPSGECEQWVPYARKAWTQGPFNSKADSIEIMATGRETRAQWMAMPIIKHGILASWIRDRLRARGLPLRWVDPVGCGVQKGGWTDHNALECGMTHHDVMPNFPYDVVRRQVRAGASTLTSNRVLCRKLNWWRRAGRPHGKPERNAIARRRMLEARGLRCVSSGPVPA